jgi:hypothetical protein
VARRTRFAFEARPEKGGFFVLKIRFPKTEQENDPERAEIDLAGEADSELWSSGARACQQIRLVHRRSAG